MLKLGLIFVLLVGASALAAGSRARRLAEAEDCGYRALICYTYEWLAAKGLPHDRPSGFEKKCPACKPTLCTEPITFAASTTKLEPAVNCDPAHYFCEESSAVNCTKPVAYENQGGKKYVLLPFNFCTREMMAKRTCPVELLSREPYRQDAVVTAPGYFAQCDAGFIVPSTVRQAHEASADPKPALTCVPSLQLAAGLVPADPSPFPKDWHDISNPTKITYCPAGSSAADCVPRPICGEGSVPAELKKISDAVPVKCVNPCVYKEKGTAADYAECQLLDVVDPEKEADVKVYVLDRQMSGPYAVLMSAAESLKYSEESNATTAATETTATTSAASSVSGPAQPSPAANVSTIEPQPRARRQDDASASPIDYKYPRCVEAKGLKEKHAAYVKADYFLNCDTNPIVARYPKDTNLRTISRPCGDVDPEKELCGGPSQSSSELSSQGSQASSKVWTIFASIGGVLLLVLGIAALVWVVYSRRRGASKQERVKPLSESAYGPEVDSSRVEDPHHSPGDAQRHLPARPLTVSIALFETIAETSHRHIHPVSSANCVFVE